MTAKQRLVVIGNGMAGARTVEEILERGGAAQIEITMFGEEPFGNYNRILLSNVLSGIEDGRASSSTACPGTPTTASRCTPVPGCGASTGSRRSCTPTTARPPRTTS
jgi:hypothetical protein